MSQSGILSTSAFGPGNVVGPGSSINGDIAIFNGTTGKIIADSGVKFPIPVASGGTGDTSLTAYSVLTGGTTSTGAVQSVSGLGTSGQILTSNGAAALPTWQDSGGGGGGIVTSRRQRKRHGIYCNAICRCSIAELW